MKIDCPYCGKETDKYVCDLGNSEDGNEIEITCGHCDRSFLATLHVDIYLDNARQCDCLDDGTKCEMEKKIIDMEFFGRPNREYLKCKNCGREVR